jgi:hypothetical protein
VKEVLVTNTTYPVLMCGECRDGEHFTGQVDVEHCDVPGCECWLSPTPVVNAAAQRGPGAS